MYDLLVSPVFFVSELQIVDREWTASSSCQTTTTFFPSFFLNQWLPVMITRRKMTLITPCDSFFDAYTMNTGNLFTLTVLTSNVVLLARFWLGIQATLSRWLCATINLLFLLIKCFSEYSPSPLNIFMVIFIRHEHAFSCGCTIVFCTACWFDSESKMKTCLCQNSI